MPVKSEVPLRPESLQYHSALEQAMGNIYYKFESFGADTQEGLKGSGLSPAMLPGRARQFVTWVDDHTIRKGNARQGFKNRSLVWRALRVIWFKAFSEQLALWLGWYDWKKFVEKHPEEDREYIDSLKLELDFASNPKLKFWASVRHHYRHNRDWLLATESQRVGKLAMIGAAGGPAMAATSAPNSNVNSQGPPGDTGTSTGDEGGPWPAPKWIKFWLWLLTLFILIDILLLLVQNSTTVADAYPELSTATQQGLPNLSIFNNGETGIFSGDKAVDVLSNVSAWQASHAAPVYASSIVVPALRRIIADTPPGIPPAIHWQNVEILPSWYFTQRENLYWVGLFISSYLFYESRVWNTILFKLKPRKEKKKKAKPSVPSSKSSLQGTINFLEQLLALTSDPAEAADIQSLINGLRAFANADTSTAGTSLDAIAAALKNLEAFNTPSGGNTVLQALGFSSTDLNYAGQQARQAVTDLATLEAKLATWQKDGKISDLLISSSAADADSRIASLKSTQKSLQDGLAYWQNLYQSASSSYASNSPYLLAIAGEITVISQDLYFMPQAIDEMQKELNIWNTPVTYKTTSVLTALGFTTASLSDSSAALNQANTDIAALNTNAANFFTTGSTKGLLLSYSGSDAQNQLTTLENKKGDLQKSLDYWKGLDATYSADYPADSPIRQAIQGQINIVQAQIDLLPSQIDEMQLEVSYWNSSSPADQKALISQIISARTNIDNSVVTNDQTTYDNFVFMSNSTVQSKVGNSTTVTDLLQSQVSLATSYMDINIETYVLLLTMAHTNPR
jgi:hypothetical protein